MATNYSCGLSLFSVFFKFVLREREMTPFLWGSDRVIPLFHYPNALGGSGTWGEVWS